MLKLLRPRRGLLWYYAVLGLIALMLVGIGGSEWLLAHQTPDGTIQLMASGSAATRYSLNTVAVRSAGGGWQSETVHFAGTVAAAPATSTLGQLQVPIGNYDAIRVGDLESPIQISVSQNGVEPVLVSVRSGRTVRTGIYAGDDQLEIGLNELAGRLAAVPQFSLVNQNGKPFTDASIRGHVAVIAAFHTNCHQTCPLYTGLFLQLAHRLPRSVMLVEVTVDPQMDTPPVLRQYKEAVGADWTFATGTVSQVESFWQPFDVELSNGNVHSSELVVIDSHGYLCDTYEGVPDIGKTLPGPLARELNVQGEQELLGHGSSGWGVGQVLNTLQAVDRPLQVSSGGEGKAPGFEAPALGGNSKVSLRQFEGQPLLLSFWASWCDACQQEMPLIRAVAAAHPGLRVVLVDERDDAGSARSALAAQGADFPVVDDPNGQIGAAYDVVGLPTSVFIEPNGIISSRYPGAMSQTTLTDNLAGLGVGS